MSRAASLLPCRRLTLTLSQRLYAAAAPLQLSDDNHAHHLLDQSPPTLFPYLIAAVHTLNWPLILNLNFPQSAASHGLPHSIECFGILIGIFASTHNHAVVRHLLNGMLIEHRMNNLCDLIPLLTSLVAASSSTWTPQQAYEAAVRVLSESSMLGDAVDAVMAGIEARLVGVHLCNRLLKRLIHNDTKLARVLFEYMKDHGPPPNVHTYTVMIDLCFKKDVPDIDEASEILSEMKRAGVAPNVVTYATYTRGLCRSRGADSAWEFLQDLRCRGLPLDGYCSNAVILGFCREGRLSRARMVLDEMLVPDVHSFSVLIDGYCRAGEVSEAYKVLVEMVGSEVMPNRVTYTSMLLGLCRRGETEMDATMVREALKLYWKAKWVSLEFDAPLCNRLLKCLVEKEEEELARTLFSDMKSSGPPPNVHTYSIMIDLCVKKDVPDIDEASKILSDMGTDGVTPNEVTYGTYIRGLCGSRGGEAAWSFLENLRRKGLPLNTNCYNAAVLGFCREGKLIRARMVFDEVKGCGLAPDVHSYSILIDAYCRAGEVSEAEKLLVEMVNSGVRPNKVTYSSILLALCMNGETQSACAMFDDCCCEHDLIGYSILINGYCRHGDLDGAARLWQEMVRSDFSPDVFSYTSVIYGCCRKGCLNEALDYLDVMLGNGVMPNVFTCTVIIDGYCKERRVVEAFRFLNGMCGYGILPNIYMYTVVINVLCKEGRPDRAWEVFGAIIKQRLVPDVVVYAILIDGFTKTSNLQEGLNLYARMLKEGIMPNIYTYTSLIDGFCSNGRLLEAMSLFEEMIGKGFTPDKVVFTSIIAGYCRNMDMKSALEQFNKMVQFGLSPDVYTYTSLIDGYSRLRKMDVAVELLNEMIRKGLAPNVVTYTALINGYRKIGDWDKAYNMHSIMLEQRVSPDTLADQLFGMQKSGG